jgi:4-carboxymuconolactone decarboxylase
MQTGQQDGPSDAYRRGVERRRRIVGERGERRRRMWAALHPDLERFVLETAWGGVLDRPGLDEKTRELITLGMLLALGRDGEARTHFHGALNSGLTKDELVELLLQAGIYAGFPAMLNGARLLAEVLEERGLLTPDNDGG